MEPTIHDVVIWADDVTLSSGQIQKAYDWRIAQWGTLANAVLTAVFFLMASALIETYKETLKLPHFWVWVTFATFIYGCIYALCRFRIKRLRQEFLALYTLLLEIT